MSRKTNWACAALLLASFACSRKPVSQPLVPLPAPVTHASGLVSQQLARGDGPSAKAGDKVTVHYEGRLEDGTRFDSSIERDKPFTFRLGAGHVVQGWDEGIVGMVPGDKRRLTIPPALGYGSQTVSGIPPNSTLVFDVELLDVK